MSIVSARSHARAWRHILAHSALGAIFSAVCLPHARAEIYGRALGSDRLILSNRNEDGALRRIGAPSPSGRDVSPSRMSSRVDSRARSPQAVPEALEALIQTAASRHRVEPSLLKAMISVESAFVATAISPKGAVGLMQLIPSTAAQYGVVADAHGTIADKLADPETNVMAGAKHLRTLLERFPGNLPLALAAYNAGEGAVSRHDNRIPPYQETQRYVHEVLARYEDFSTTHGK